MASGYFKDPDFQQKLVMFLCKDRNFLKNTAPLLKAEDFKPTKGGTPELHMIAELALNFWNEFSEPIGGMLRTEVIDLARKKKLSSKSRERILDLVDGIRKADGLVAVEALERKVVEYKSRRARQAAVQQIIKLEEEGELSNERLVKICSSVLKNFSSPFTVTDYFETMPQRLSRRRLDKLRKWPYIFIDPIDERIRVLSRGNIGLALAQYKVGKSVFLIWLAYAYALQGYKVLYYTLEDPKEEVEDRLDSLFSRVAIKNLTEKPVRVKKQFKKAKSIIKAKIKIVDGTEGGMSVAMIESIWDQERNKGYAADLVIIDYDDEIEPPKHYGSDKGARRFEFADIYRELRRFASRRKIYLWTAAQAKRGKEDQRIISGKDTAEDISKIRKVAFCLGIGRNPEFGANGRYIYVAAHKYDQSRIGFDTVGYFEKGIFYDRESTVKMMARVVNRRKKGKGGYDTPEGKHKKETHRHFPDYEDKKK